MKKFSAISLMLAMLLSSTLFLAGCAPKEKADDVFRVGMECGYAPFNWTQMTDANNAVPLSDGSYAGGYDVAIAQEIAKALGKKLEIVKMEWDGLAPSLTTDKIDAIIAGMSATTDRKESIDFSDMYYLSDLVVVVKKDGAYANAKTLKDFSGSKITGQLNTLHYSVIDQIPDVDMQPPMKTFPVMIAALDSGKVDGYVSERPGALAATFSNPGLSFVSFETGEGFDYDGAEVSISVGLVKGSPLKEDINKALAAISQEKRDQLMEDAIKNQPLAN